MKSYETIATVEREGEVRIAGVPFAPGTEVAVTISPKHATGEDAASIGQRNLETLLSALDKARNMQSVGALRREELYDRDVLH